MTSTSTPVPITTSATPRVPPPRGDVSPVTEAGPALPSSQRRRGRGAGAPVGTHKVRGLTGGSREEDDAGDTIGWWFSGSLRHRPSVPPQRPVLQGRPRLWCRRLVFLPRGSRRTGVRGGDDPHPVQVGPVTLVRVASTPSGGSGLGAGPTTHPSSPCPRKDPRLRKERVREGRRVWGGT